MQACHATLRGSLLLDSVAHHIFVESIAHTLTESVDARVTARRFRFLITDTFEVAIGVECSSMWCKFDSPRVMHRMVPERV